MHLFLDIIIQMKNAEAEKKQTNGNAKLMVNSNNELGLVCER